MHRGLRCFASEIECVREIKIIDDVINYFECNFQDFDGFFLCGQYELLTAGLVPEKVRSSIISGLGEFIIERALPNDAKCEIFFFNGKCSMLDGTEVQIVDSEKEAIMIACIEEVLFNELSYD